MQEMQVALLGNIQPLQVILGWVFAALGEREFAELVNDKEICGQASSMVLQIDLLPDALSVVMNALDKSGNKVEAFLAGLYREMIQAQRDSRTLNPWMAKLLLRASRRWFPLPVPDFT